MYQQLFTDFSAQKNLFYFLGRVRFDGSSPVLSWSASGVLITFRGTRLVIHTHQDEPYNFYENGEPMPIVLRTDVDDMTQKHCLLGQLGCVIISDLPDTIHTLRLVRASAGCDRVWLDRLEISGEEAALLPCSPSFEKKIEFIGDSITCGYGLMGSRPMNDTTEEDAAMTYAFLTGEALRADTRLISWSGRGLHCSCAGETDRRFLDLFNAAERTMELPPYTFGDWIPDCVVINGGTNDAGGHATSEEFRTAVLELYQRVRCVYPRAQIVYMIGLMGNAYHDTLQQIEIQIRQTDKAFRYFPVRSIYGDPAEVGANGHPSFVGHKRGAAELTAYLKNIL